MVNDRLRPPSIPHPLPQKEQAMSEPENSSNENTVEITSQTVALGFQAICKIVHDTLRQVTGGEAMLGAAVARRISFEMDELVKFDMAQALAQRQIQQFHNPQQPQETSSPEPETETKPEADATA